MVKILDYNIKNILLIHIGNTIETYSRIDKALLNVETFEIEQEARAELMLQLKILLAK